MIDTLHEPTTGRRHSRRRWVALAGALTALALAAGAGAASAAEAPTPVETGYAVVVDETIPTTPESLCPDQANSTDGDL